MLLWGFAPPYPSEALPKSHMDAMVAVDATPASGPRLARSSRRGGGAKESQPSAAAASARSARKKGGDGDKGLYIDQSEKSLSRMPSSKKRMLTSEKSYKVNKGKMANTSIDFDETDITGQRRDPGVGFVKSTSKGDAMNFVKIRRKWHDSMVKSTLLVD